MGGPGGCVALRVPRRRRGFAPGGREARAMGVGVAARPPEGAEKDVIVSIPPAAGQTGVWA
eukprot:3195816-Lingulodinium_polyedra.AAC.1